MTDSYEDLDRQTDELLNSSLKALQEGSTEGPPSGAGPSGGPSIEEQLALAKASRNQAESARQKIANEILAATKEVCQKLISEGELTLDKAKKLEAAAEQKQLDAQSELQRAQAARSEAETYAEKLRAEAQQQAQEATERAQATRDDANAWAEKLRSEAQQQAQEATERAQTTQDDADAWAEKLRSESQQQAQEASEQAQSVRDDADAHAEKVVADAERVAAELIESTRSVAEQEANDLKQQAVQESQRTLSEAELIRIAAQEELEAQRIYAETAKVTAESIEVLAQIRAKLAESPESQDNDSDEIAPSDDFDPNWQPVGKIRAKSAHREKPGEKPGEIPAADRPTVDIYNNRRKD